MEYQLSPPHGGTAYQCSVPLPYEMPSTKYRSTKEKRKELKEIDIVLTMRKCNTWSLLQHLLPISMDHLLILVVK
jgi:hypothetical protein